MPADYEKKPYVPNVDKFKSNADKAREAEKKAPPRERYTDSDNTKLPAVQPKPKPKG